MLCRGVRFGFFEATCRAVIFSCVAFFIIAIDSQNIAKGGEIIVDNSPVFEAEGDIVLPVIGIRRMADVGWKNADGLSRLRVSKDLIVRSAVEFEEISGAMREIGLTASDITLKELKEVILDSEYSHNYLFDPSDPWRNIGKKGKFIISKYANHPAFRTWDAALVTNMFATGVFDIDTVKYDQIQGEEFVNIARDYKSTLIEVYKKLPLISKYEGYNLPVALNRLKDGVRNYTSLEQSLLQNYGRISFGAVFFSTSAERDLILPLDISSKYDVYWLELFSTFRDLIAENLTEIVLNFGLPKDSLALELIPFRFVEKLEITKEYSTPEVRVGLVSLGEFFKQTVSYSYLKPVVLAFGVREPNFSWGLQESAVIAGSHRFVAIIGVPKGTKSITLEMSAHVKFKAKFLAGGGIAGTPIEYRELQFPIETSN